MELVGVRETDGSWRFDDTAATTDRTPGEVSRFPDPELDEQAATVAAAIPVKPPADWFADPSLDGPTALTVTADGRVFGHAAAWGVRHVGLPGCRTAPKSPSGYRYYRTGQVETDDGAMIATGRITMGAGHADLSGNLTAASDHYDNVCSAVADVTCGEDAHGIWYAGALRPETTPEQVRTLRASSLSGDWRPVGNGLEMVGLLAVNVAGFPTPRAALAASGHSIAALVAAGVVAREEPTVAAPVPPAPPAKTPAGPAPGAPGPAAGDMVTIGDSGLVGQVTDVNEDGVAVEITCDPDELAPADQSDAMAASAARTKRAQMRTLVARVDRSESELRGMKGEKLLAAVPAE